MALDIKPRLKAENSIIASLGVAGLVIGVYQGMVGPVSDVHATGANDLNMQASVRKAGWASVVTVSAVGLLARDPNIIILGGIAIIVEEVMYRHAIFTNPATGQIQVDAGAYASAGSHGSVGLSGGLSAVA